MYDCGGKAVSRGTSFVCDHGSRWERTKDKVIGNKVVNELRGQVLAITMDLSLQTLK